MQSKNKQVCIDLGCGMRKPADNETQKWFGVDIRPFKGVDYVVNIGKEKLPFDDDSVDFIQAIHLFEHMYPEELFFCIDECFRVMKPTGKLHIEVPRAGTQAYFVHPDHKIQFTNDTWGFFMVPDNDGTIDPHGYLNGFWRLEFIPNGNPENIGLDMYPNKPGGKFEYKKVTKVEDK